MIVDALPLIHSDEQLAVANKPAGLMPHASALAGGETDSAAERLRRQMGRPIYLAHRLDRATSGCLLFAFDRDIAATLGAQFMGREVEKTYLAVCRGWPAQDFLIDHPLDGGPGKPEKKPAVTRFSRLAIGELDEAAAGFPTSRYALLACTPETGRFRQIRRHLKHASHHLIGDTSHGDGRRNEQFRQRGISRMLLHGWRLGFRHPASGARMVASAEPDAQFRAALALFGWALPE
ncbi:MAG: pseudouridine synthase [Lysobacteraceae bacterium]